MTTTKSKPKARRSGKKPLALTAQQVADELQVHVNTVYRELEAGKIPGIKVRGAWRIPEWLLREHMEDEVRRRRECLGE